MLAGMSDLHFYAGVFQYLFLQQVAHSILRGVYHEDLRIGAEQKMAGAFSAWAGLGITGQTSCARAQRLMAMVVMKRSVLSMDIDWLKF